MRTSAIRREASGDRHHRSVELLRQAVYGTIILLGVLAVLSEKEPSALDAALSVAGTAVVLFLAHVYAGFVAERIGVGRETTPGIRRRLAAESWPLVTVTVWPLALLGLSALGLMSAATAVTVSIWLSLAGLAFWGWQAGAIGHERLPLRLWFGARSLAVGFAIVALKIVFH